MDKQKITELTQKHYGLSRFLAQEVKQDIDWAAERISVQEAQ